MAPILTLLISAVQLLTLAQSNPNLPQSFRDSAISLANYSIQVAQEAIKNQSNEIATATVNIPVIEPQVNYGSVIQPQTIIMPEVKKEIRINNLNRSINYEGAYYSFNASYLEDDKELPGISITISSDDDGKIQSNGIEYTKTATQITRKLDNAAWFQYLPKDEGMRTLTITANGITATTTLRGQAPQSEWKKYGE
jgi:hypothetical protein